MKKLIKITAMLLCACLAGVGNISLAMGQQGAGDSATDTDMVKQETEIKKVPLGEERRKQLWHAIQNKPQGEEKGYLEMSQQIKYQASFDLMASNHDEKDVRFLIEQFRKEKDLISKGQMLDALSLSPYKEIVATAYKDIAKNYPDLSLRALAAMKMIQIGDEEEGWKYSKDIIEEMNKTGTLVQRFAPMFFIKSNKIKSEVKKYYEEIIGDESRNQFVRCYAILQSARYFDYVITKHETFIESALMGTKVNYETADEILYLLQTIAFTQREVAINLLGRATKSSNQKIAQDAAARLRKIQRSRWYQEWLKAK